MTRRGHAFAVFGLVAALGGASVAVQMTRDAWYHTDKPAERMLYVRSGEAVRRMALSYDAIAADIYWIRALQYFGGERQSQGRDKYALLHPLLDLTTTLDPRFNLAYRFGALFLMESPPGGPGRPDLALALLHKGIKAMPDKWQYYQDAGFVHYFGTHDYQQAAEWFQKGAAIDGAPQFLKSLAANTLAKGQDRRASRLLYQTILETAEQDFMKKDAARRLRQLSAMDGIDALRKIVGQYRARTAAADAAGQARSAQGLRALTWRTLVAAGWLREPPRDPDGFEFTLDPLTGDVHLNDKSTLHPLPTEKPSAKPADMTSVPAS